MAGHNHLRQTHSPHGRAGDMVPRLHTILLEAVSSSSTGQQLLNNSSRGLVDGAKVKVPPLAFDHQRSLLYLSVNRADVFTDYPDEKQLYRRKKEQPYEKRSQPQLESVPKDQLQHEKSHCDH